MPATRQLSYLLSVTALAAALAACGGGGTATTPLNSYDPSNPGDNVVACVPGNDVIGAWKTATDNNTVMPDSPQLNFFSYNQPSINTYGLLVFRGRARTASGGGGSDAQPQRGVYTVDMCPAKPAIYTVADTATVPVPAPNNTGATFNEFPSIPRIDMDSGLVATRGQSTPVWTYTDPATGTETRIGTTGLYATMPGGLVTGINILGAVAEFAYMQVPNASTTGVRFDQFPGSPSVTGGRYLVTKGNYTDTVAGASVGKTGIYFRDLKTADAAVQVIADSNTPIPGTATASAPAGTNFGSTAPPSAAAGQVVFTGLDNEASPSAGGIYLAPLASLPTLTPLVQIGSTVVPDKTGAPLPPIAPAATSPVFTQVGEGLSFDGVEVAFWGAWDTGALDSQGNGPGMHGVTLTCPTDGSKQLQAACQSGATSNGNGGWQTTRYVPDHQGLFVVDTRSGAIRMIAEAGSDPGAQFQDFLFWTFSGAAPSSSGSSDVTDAEPPRWRASGFAAVDSHRGVIFKGALNPAYIADAPASGIYGVAFNGSTIGPLFKVVAVGDSMNTLDPAAPAGSSVTAVAVERESLRGGWLALSAASLNAAGESWAGIYVTDLPNGFKDDGASPLPNLVLGR